MEEAQEIALKLTHKDEAAATAKDYKQWGSMAYLTSE
jgi:hypothetical protein